MDQNYRLNTVEHRPANIIVKVDTALQDFRLAPLTMEAFLADIEKKAYHIAAFAAGSHADALDLIQDSMIKLVTNYADKPAEQWKPLFYKILRNRITDWHRHQKVKNLLFFRKNPQNEDKEDEWPPAMNVEQNPDTPEAVLKKAQQQATAIEHLKTLSGKQQQCFLLRSWEGMSTAQTADIMGCSQGSVKTHYSRAVIKMRTLMEADDHEITL
jgi:RNA polymerase sigma-70 factor (ECF subfamily)